MLQPTRAPVGRSWRPSSAPARSGRPPQTRNLQPPVAPPRCLPDAARSRAANPLSSETRARFTARLPVEVIAPSASERARSSSAAVSGRGGQWQPARRDSGSPSGSAARAAGIRGAPGCPLRLRTGTRPARRARPLRASCRRRRRQPPSPRRARVVPGSPAVSTAKAPLASAREPEVGLRHQRGQGRGAPSRPHRRPPPPACRRPAAPPAGKSAAHGARGLLGHAAHGRADREVRAVEAADEAAVGARRVGLQRLGDGGDHAVGAVAPMLRFSSARSGMHAAPGRPRRCRPSRCRAASSWP